MGAPAFQQGLLLKAQTAPATPATNHIALYSTDGVALLMKDEAGQVFRVGPNVEAAVFSSSGVQTAHTGLSRYPLVGAGVILSVTAMLNTAPTGATTFKVDVNKNGTTIYGTQGNRPIWTASANAATVGAHSVTTYADGDYLSCDIDAIGSTVAGSDLVVVVRHIRTS